MDETGGWVDRISEFFLPESTRQAGGIEQRRAELTVQTVLVLLCWGPLFGVVYFYLFGSPFGAAVMAIGSVMTGLSLFLMRWLGRPAWAGNFMIFCVFSAGVVVSFYNGGIRAPSLAWLGLCPLFGLLFAGRRSGWFWLVAALVVFGAFYGIEAFGGGAPQWLATWEVTLLELLGMVGLTIVAFAIVRSDESLQGWLVDNLRARETETRAILQTAPDGIMTVDPGGRIEGANRAVGEMFDIDAEVLAGRPVSELFEDWSWEEGFDGRTEYTGRRSDGQTFPVDVSVGEFSGGRDGTILAVRDVTDQRRREQELKRARDQALEANEAKSTFLANMSHELRTPLNAIIGYSEMLRKDVESVDEERSVDEVVTRGRLVEDLDRVESAGNQLLALIDDVLDLSKIEAGQVDTHYEMVDLEMFFGELRSTLEPLAADNDNGLVVDADDLGRMRTDPQKVRQILLNLASNACKFTEEGTVRVAARRVDQGGAVAFEVADTGIGMDDEELERVFEAFSQADASTTREFGGTGLGLTIVDHFTELLGGEVHVDSEPGEGTTFTIWLPDEQSDEAASEEPEAEPETDEAAALLDEAVDGGERGAREGGELVLVIDDDGDVRELLSRVAERAGYQVATAADGEEGLRMARRLRPTAITLDVKMPGMDGWSLLSELADDPRLSDIPVVMVTMIEDRSHGVAVEADHYLRKPIDREEMVEVLAEYRTDGTDEILLVEDDEPTREMMRRNLEGQDWQVVEATNGREALDVLDDQGVPAVVLLDLMMPEMDGFDFLARVRLGDYPYVPIVVVTAKELTDRDREVLDREVVEIVKKGGYDRDQLLEEVEHLVERAAGRGSTG